jgi:hypothetical protein
MHYYGAFIDKKRTIKVQNMFLQDQAKIFHIFFAKHTCVFYL